ncbi:predicted protein [Naegleria gruberi]|uniref:Predicted protein n=1 Tax=Naegleria gruberi TaxID=5762 RepID=D2VZL6_NAEGR|nr:uncharacterized protein NAEGRDRAFT_74532 [Naegleria gruberi]EFC37679.1 predicted protein [Naegleria gruberi]|eukprot:XP_002670423.1 predicted protein [Naegleria gruberi strain NEG-M]
MGNSRSILPPTSSNNLLPNIKIGNSNADSSISNSTITHDEDKTEAGYRQSISSLPFSSKRPSIRPTHLKSPKGSISFTQGLTNNTHNNTNHHHNSKNMLPPLVTNKPNSLSTPPSLDTLSIDQSSSNNILGIRQVISNDSFQTISSSTYSSSLSNKTLENSSMNNTLRVNETSSTLNTRATSPIQFGRRTSSTQALNSLAKSRGKGSAVSPKNINTQQLSSLSNNNNTTSIKNRSNDSPEIPSSPTNNNKTSSLTAGAASSCPSNSPNANNNNIIASISNSENYGPNSSALFLEPLPNLNKSNTDAYESEDEPSTFIMPNKLISTDSFSLISSHKRVGAKLMFDRDAVNNSNVSKLDDCDTGSEISRQEDEQPLILTSTLDVDMMMNQKKLASISTPPRAQTLTATMESPDIFFDTPPQRETSMKNIASAPNLLYDSLSRKMDEKERSLIDSLTLDKSSTISPSSSIDVKKTNKMRRSVGDSDDILDDILSEKPTLKSLKKLKSENSVRRRATSLNNSKAGKKSAEKNSTYLRENDGISTNIMDILKGCEDLLGDLELEPKCPCTIEITQPDANPETSHLLPLQNSRRFNLLTVPDLKQVMRESRSEQKQHERKQKNVKKEVANIIKDIRSSFSEFDF